MAQTKRIKVINKKSSTTLMKGYVKGHIKELKILLSALGIATIITAPASFNNFLENTSPAKKNAIENFENNIDRSNIEILDLYVEDALGDLSLDEKKADAYENINEVYQKAKKAYAISSTCNSEQYELYKATSSRAKEDYKEAADMLFEEGYIFGYGAYSLYANAIVNDNQEVLFEVTPNGIYGTITEANLPDDIDIELSRVYQDRKYVLATDYINATKNERKAHVK